MPFGGKIVSNVRKHYRNAEHVYKMDVSPNIKMKDCTLGDITLVEYDHEIISMVIFSLLLIQERQLSFTGKSMCTSTG